MRKLCTVIFTGLFLLAGCSVTEKTPLAVYQPELPEIILTREHGLFIDDNGDLYSWGYDDYNAGSASGFRNSLGQGTEVLYHNIPEKIYSEAAFVQFGSKGVTKTGELFEWGKLLEDDPCVPHNVKENVVKINWTLYLTKDGELRTMPAYEDPFLKRPYSESGELVMTGVKDFLIGYTYFALKDDGSVWTFVLNGFGDIVERPKLLIKDVVKLYSGAQTAAAALFLKADGTLWSCGGNEYGQCGNGEHGDLDLKTQDCVVSEPYKMAENVIDAWMTDTTTFYLTEDNKLYACGQNFYDLLLLGGNGQMNPKNHPEFAATPVLIMEKVKQMESSDLCMFVLRTDNTVWSWGYADKGFSGNGTCYEGDDLGGTVLNERFQNNKALYSQPGQIMGDVKRLFTETTGLHFVQKNDGSIWYWGFGLIYADQEDVWDNQLNAWKNKDGEHITAYQKHYIIPAPIEFKVDTFFQNALDAIAAREGIDTSQYQAVRYVNE